MKRISFFVIALIAAAALPSYCQKDTLSVLVKKFDDYRSHVLQEKIFIHADRSFYLTGETMWLKIYCVDASFHKPQLISKVAYVELLDKENKVVLQSKLSLQGGIAAGSLFLPASLSSGSYILRAYTLWMRNFSPDLYFHQSITLVNPFTPLGPKAQAANPDYDVQFFPEGGHLVEGLVSKVAFRVVDQAGNGMVFKGALLNEANDTVVTFHPLKFGLGQFIFKPVAGHQYKVVIRDERQMNIPAALPVIETEGFVISAKDTSNNRVKVKVTLKRSQPGQDPFVYLLIHTRNRVGSAQARLLEDGKATFLIDQSALKEGISHFTLFNNKLEPVCERLYFKRPENPLTIEVQAGATDFGSREKVELNLITSADGKPVESNLSIAVFKEDSLRSSRTTDFATFLWLTSELKGTIESPDYYLEGTTPWEAVENLMLTHGWSRFRWDEVLKPEKVVPAFLPEYRGHLLRGRVMSTVSGKPVAGISTTLSTPGKNIQLYLSRSANDGHVQFELQEFFGTRRIVLQTNTEIDSTYRIEIESPYSSAFAAYRPPVFSLSGNLKDALASRSLEMQLQSIFFEENSRTIDREVNRVPFYGRPDETYFLDEYTRFPTMEEVMREYVPGVMVRKRKDKFLLLIVNKDNNTLFKENPLVLVDGVPVYNMNKIMEFDPRKIQKLDVMTRKYFLGHLSFNGLVSYTTYLGDLSDFDLDPLALSVNYEGLQQKREFFSPRYETVSEKESRIPDARNLLYWAPEVKTDKAGKQMVNFFSSDIPGTYRAVVQGISPGGKPGSGSFVFKVTRHESY